MTKLTKEERDLKRSVERGEWRSLGKKEARRYQSYAKATLRKSKRINIRLAPGDLEGVQRRAVAEGIPYQTLVASVIHKYVTGRLIELGQRQISPELFDELFDNGADMTPFLDLKNIVVVRPKPKR